jgi:hypothetical protein
VSISGGHPAGLCHPGLRLFEQAVAVFELVDDAGGGSSRVGCHCLMLTVIGGGVKESVTTDV